MKQSKIKWSMLVILMAVVMVLAGCNKKVKPAPPPPAPPPPPAAPTATLSADPNTIEKGQSTTLTWQTTNATDVTLGPNKVDGNGSATFSPTDSTTFRLVAKGPGGTQEATARVTVTTPPPPPPPQPTATDQELFNQNIKDVYFDYDSYDLRGDGQSAVAADAQFLKAHPGITLTVEGHCDERGSTEYNLALGDNRASAVKTALTQAGVSADRIKTISFGKEKPFCTESNEQCWQQNRRGHFVFGK